MNAALYWLFVTGHRKAIEARRRGRRTQYLAWSAIAAVCAALAIAVIAGLAGLFLIVGWWWAALVVGYVAILPVAAPALLTYVAVPLGAVRAAAFLGRRTLAAGADPEAAAQVWSARALACRRAPTAAMFAHVEARRAARGRVGDAEVVATGLIAAARGDRDAARTLIESCAELAELHAAVRELAGEWLAADDAEAGAWARILARADEPAAWPATPTTYLLEGVAARALARPGAPTPAHLLVRWLEAPRRAVTWPLVARALRASEAAPAQPGAATATATAAAQTTTAAATAETAAPAAPLAAALAAHAALARGERSAAQVVAAAAAWDRALADPDTRIAVLSRAAALGAPPDAGDRALRELAAAAAADLAAAAEAAGVGPALLPAAAGSPILAEAARRVRARLLGDLELAFARLADRCAARDALPAVDEWRELCALRAAYARAAAAGGVELRRLAFVHAHLAVGRLSVWLWNERGEHILSHAMSAWLAAEALEVGDAQALETHAANARMRVPVRAR